ncbi:MAG: hypothetical protein JWM12_750 [Ilumatobacteraceae bacterium]|nr:hypothetical protein [Ilumatobacteraceae bacterium]
MPGPVGPSAAECELCEAAKTTDWFFEDDLCWVAECEMCWVPMVVWKHHDPHPPAEVRATMLAHLAQAVAREYTFEQFYIDDNMRTIPTHYHAHARPRGGFYGHGLRRE